MSSLLWVLYAVVGLVLSQMAMGRMLRGNHTAARTVHFGIAGVGLLVVVAWPVVLFAYANFLLAKVLHRQWLEAEAVVLNRVRQARQRA